MNFETNEQLGTRLADEINNVATQYNVSPVKKQEIIAQHLQSIQDEYGSSVAEIVKSKTAPKESNFFSDNYNKFMMGVQQAQQPFMSFIDPSGNWATENRAELEEHRNRLSETAQIEMHEAEQRSAAARGTGVGNEFMAGLRNFTADPLGSTAQMLPQVLPQVALLGATALTGGAAAPVTLPAMGLLGGIQGAGAVREDIYTQTQAQNDETLKTHNAQYQQLRANGVSEEQAKQIVGTNIADNIGEITGAAATGAALERLGGLSNAMLGKGGGLRNFMTEVATETGDEAAQTMLSNNAVQRVNPETNLTDGLGEALLYGGIMGGATGGLAAWRNPSSTPAQTTPSVADSLLQSAKESAEQLSLPSPHEFLSLPAPPHEQQFALSAPRELLALPAPYEYQSSSETQTTPNLPALPAPQKQDSLPSPQAIMQLEDPMTIHLRGLLNKHLDLLGEQRPDEDTEQWRKRIAKTDLEAKRQEFREQFLKDFSVEDFRNGSVFTSSLFNEKDRKNAKQNEYRQFVRALVSDFNPDFEAARRSRTDERILAKEYLEKAQEEERQRLREINKNKYFENITEEQEAQPPTTSPEAASAKKNTNSELLKLLWGAGLRPSATPAQTNSQTLTATQPSLFQQANAATTNTGKIATGKQSSVDIGNQNQSVTWEIREASDLGASIDKASNQFRDRTRNASQAQIQKIAQNPDYRYLGDSPIMDMGAPTLAQDGNTIIGGNGRTAGVKQAYAQGTADNYRQNLIANATQYGFTPEQIQTFSQPILTRRLNNPVDIAQAAIASNEGGGLAMSALEQAKADATRLPPLDLFTFSETGSLNNGANRNAITQWIGQYPQNQQAALQTADGMLSQTGLDRLQNAMLYQAYGDSPTLARMIESTSVESKNVNNALTQSANTVAQASNEMAYGNLYDLNIADDLTQAADLFEQLRADGVNISDWLAQENLIAEIAPSDEARLLVRFFSDHARSAKAIRDMISAYYAEVQNLGSPNQADMFGDNITPTKQELLRKAMQYEPTENATHSPNNQPTDNTKSQSRVTSPDVQPENQPPVRTSDWQSDSESGANEPEQVDFRQPENAEAVSSNRAQYDQATQIKSAIGNNGLFDSSNPDIRFSRTNATQTQYEQRIDDIFAGKTFRDQVRVLDRSDLLDMLGYGNQEVVLVNSKVNAEKHSNMTAEQWKKVPEWLDNPSMVFHSDTVAGRLVFIAPESVENNPVKIILEPKGGKLEAHVLLNAYDMHETVVQTQGQHGGNPFTTFAHWRDTDKLLYIDKEKTSRLASRLGLLLPQRLLQPTGRVKILTEKNLQGYRKNTPFDENQTRNSQSPNPVSDRATATKIAAYKTAISGSLKQHAHLVKVVSRGDLVRPENAHDLIGVEGFYNPANGSITLIAENLRDANHARFVAWHELAHRKADLTGYAQWQAAFDRAGKHETVKKLADKIQAQRKNTSDPAATNRTLAHEEAMAELYAAHETGDYAALESKYDIKIPRALKNNMGGFLSRIGELLAQVWRKVTGNTQVSSADVYQLLRDLSRAEVSGSLKKQDSGTSYSRPNFGIRADLFDLPAVPITRIDTSNLPNNFKDMKILADKLLRDLQSAPVGALHNDDMDVDLQINKTDRKKMGKNLDLTHQTSQSITQLVDLIKNAIRAETHADEHHNNPDVKAVHRLYAPAEIDGKIYRVKLTVKDYVFTNGTEQKNLHAIEAAEIENAPMGTVPSYSASNDVQTAQPTSGRTLSIADLMRGASQNNGEPFSGSLKRSETDRTAYDQAKADGETELTFAQWQQVRTPEFKAWFGDWENDPENASKVINPRTGEPLVVYHGTNSDFYTFDIKKLSSNTGNNGHYGAGFYFSDEIKESERYGTKILNAFLNIKKPFKKNDIEFIFNKYADEFNIERVLTSIDDDWARNQLAKEHPKLAEFYDEILNNGRTGTDWLKYEDISEFSNPNGYDLNSLADFIQSNQEKEVDAYLLTEIIGEIPEYVKHYTASISSGHLPFLTDLGSRGKHLTEVLKKEAFDGVWQDAEIVVFHPNQIKSATDNVGTFDPNNDDIRYSHSTKNRSLLTSFGLQLPTEKSMNGLGNTALRASELVNSEHSGSLNAIRYSRGITQKDVEAFTRAGKIEHDPTLINALRGDRTAEYLSGKKQEKEKIQDWLIEGFVDVLHPVAKWIDSLPLAEISRALFKGAMYRAEGMRDYQNHEITEQFINPMNKELARIAKKTKLEILEVKRLIGFWGSANYAPEANARLLKQAADEITAANQSGDQNKIQKATEKYKDLRDRINGLKDGKVAGGYSNPFAAQVKSNVEKHIDKQDIEKVMSYIHGMLQYKLDLDLKSGRISQKMYNDFKANKNYVPLTGDPINNLQDDNDFIGNSGSLNQSKEKKMGGRESMAEDAIDAALSAVSKSTTIYGWADFKNHLNDIYETTHAQKIAAGKTPAEAEKEIEEEFGMRRETLKGITRPSDNVIIYQKNGQYYQYRLNDTLTAALQNGTAEQANAFLNLIGKPTRLYARAVTQFTPAFAPINSIRDIWEKSEMIRTFKAWDGAGNAVDMDKVARSAVANFVTTKSIRQAFQAAWRNDFSGEMGADLKEFLTLGGVSTQGTMLSPTEADLVKKIKNHANLPAKTIEKGLKYVESYNQMFDLAPAFALYQAMKKHGISSEQAASLALDTTNFRKKGKYMSGVRAIYMFSQPIAQGAYNLSRYLNTKKGRNRALAHIALGIVLYSALRAAHDDDEGGNKLDQQGDITRFIPLPLGDGTYAKIPVGFGMPQFAWNIATNAVRAFHGNLTPAEAMVEIATHWAKTIAPISPSSIPVAEYPAAKTALTLTPTIFQPIMQNALNRNAFGLQITPSFARNDKLKAEQSKTTTAPEWKDAALFLQRNTGIDMHPEQVKNLVNGYAVSILRDGLNYWIENPNNESLGRTPKTPLINSIIGAGNEFAIQGQYYNAMNEAQKLHQEYQNRKKNNDLKEWLTPEKRKILKWYDKAKRAEEQLNKTKSRATRRYNKGSMTEEDYRALTVRVTAKRLDYQKPLLSERLQIDK